MFKKIFQKKPNYQTNLAPNIPQSKVFFQQAPKPTWTDRNYEQFAREAYMKNVIAFRCVNLIAKSASSIPLEVLELNENGVYVPKQDLGSFKFLTKPNRKQTISLFLEEVYSYILLSGNAFLYMDKEGALINAIESIRPDLMQVLRSNDEEEVLGYKYKTNFVEEAFMFENQTGKCDILHIKTFHPLSDFYGLSPIDPARYAIDQHNDLSAYNKSLLQNSARPSGALMVKATDFNNGGQLTEEQFTRLKEQMNEQFSGTANAGKPLLLEGGLEWTEMSISPKEMDFIENKRAAARDIALAFGVPPQLLGIPGDNTYSNMSQASLSLWTETINPLINHFTTALNEWVIRQTGDENIKITYNQALIPSNALQNA